MSVPDLRDAKIAIALPSHDYVPATFAADLANLTAYTVNNLPIEIACPKCKWSNGQKDVPFGVLLRAGTYVHSARQELLMEMIQQGVTHVLWLDTDMRFPPDALVKLMLHNLPMVGINYAKRRVPTGFVAIKKIGWGEGEASERLQTTSESTGLEEVEAIGFGMVLMKIEALADMPDPREEPWFWFHWVKEKFMQVGEDVQFCRLFRESGQRIFVDHDLSKQCAHIGLFEYKCAHAEAEEAA